MFKIPYSLLPIKVLKKGSSIFLGIGRSLEKNFPFLKLHLKQAEVDFSVKEYLSMCFLSGIIFFVFLQQLTYPKIYSNKRIKDIEKNLLAALQNMLIQLNSGVPIFDILVNLSKGNYGEISREFQNVVKKINAGKPQIETLEEMATLNPSLFFRRAIWHLVNGMKAGADMSDVIKEMVNLLAEEQILQIQRYGSQLNPLAMFYMLIVVIAPSLGMTFLIIISSFISLSETATKLVFYGLFGIVIFFQIMFMGMIKAKRPNLLG